MNNQPKGLDGKWRTNDASQRTVNNAHLSSRSVETVAIFHKSRPNLFNLFITDPDEKNQKFEVHKSILIARSDVFAAMLQSDSLSETRDNQLTIKDIKPDALKEMLRFLYTDEVAHSLVPLRLIFSLNSPFGYY